LEGKGGFVKFAIVGPGSLGCVVAGVLVRGGHRVTLFGRGRALDLLSKHGVVIHGLEELRVRVPVTDRLEDLGEPDLLLICTKALGTRDLLDKLRAVPAAAVASLQNGILKDRLLAQAFGPERVLGAATMVSAQRHVDGSVTWAGRGVTYFGEPDGGESGRLRAVVEVWREAGLPAQAVPDIDALEWSKTAMVAGSFAVSVLSRWPMYQVFADPDLCDVFLALVRETATLAAAHGVEIDDYAGLPARAYATLPREEARGGGGPAAPPPQRAPPCSRICWRGGRWRWRRSSEACWRTPLGWAWPYHWSRPPTICFVRSTGTGARGNPRRSSRIVSAREREARKGVDRCDG
jgi:2-dehydropantoate 2-reductase